MSINSIIKMIGCTLMVVAAYGFANYRFNQRSVKHVKVLFTEDKALFISENNVNKLLIQNYDSIHNVPIEHLDLNRSEVDLIDNPMIRHAEVSVSLNGEILASIEQRKPIARLMGIQQQYLDSDNQLMPLSNEHTAFVPLVFGFTDRYQDELYTLIDFINEDEYLQPAVTQLKLNSDGEVSFNVRAYDYNVKLGKVEQLHHKMTNYKAFIAKMKKDQKLSHVKTIDLRYKNQVISIKK